jgi:hypothetical protein
MEVITDDFLVKTEKDAGTHFLRAVKIENAIVFVLKIINIFVLYFAYCGDIFGMKRTNKFYL